MIEQHHIDGAKVVGDGASILAVIGWLAGLLPAFATLASLIYMCIRIYETPTVQGLIKRWKERHARVPQVDQEPGDKSGPVGQ